MIPFRGGSSTLTERSAEVELRLDDWHFPRSINRGLARQDRCPGSVDLRKGNTPLLSTKPSEFGFETAYLSARGSHGRCKLTWDKTRSSPNLDLFLRSLEAEQTPPSISKSPKNRYPPFRRLWDRYIRWRLSEDGKGSTIGRRR